MTKQELAEIIETAGQNWVLSRDRDEILDGLLAKLTKVYNVFADEGFEGDGISLSDESVRNEPDPSRVEALMQALPSRSPKFIAAIWRIVHGDKITAVNMSYQEREKFELRVCFLSKQGRQREVTSSDIEDAAFVRYLWIGRINGKPFFAGYFPPRFSSKSSAAIQGGS